jgi:hypothetical protein
VPTYTESGSIAEGLLASGSVQLAAYRTGLITETLLATGAAPRSVHLAGNIAETLTPTVGYAYGHALGGTIAATLTPSALLVIRVQRGDSATASESSVSRVVKRVIADSISGYDGAIGQAKNPQAQVGIDLIAYQQSQDVLLVLSSDPASTVASSITPAVITMYATDSGPVLRLRVVDDDTLLPADLTGATCQFTVRRQNAPAAALPVALTGCTTLPNPALLTQAVVASGTAQNVVVSSNTTLGAAGSSPNIAVGVPGTSTYEIVNLFINSDGVHVYGVFTQNHNIGEPLCVPGVSSPDPIYNAHNGYVLYAWPQGAPATPGTYFGQLKVDFASGVIEHTALVQINVQPVL